MKHTKITARDFPSNTFFFDVPLMGEELDYFGKEINKFFQGRGESSHNLKEELLVSLDFYTKLNKEKIEEESNRIVKNIIQRRKHDIHSVSVKKTKQES